MYPTHLAKLHSKLPTHPEQFQYFAMLAKQRGPALDIKGLVDWPGTPERWLLSIHTITKSRTYWQTPFSWPFSPFWNWNLDLTNQTNPTPWPRNCHP